MSATASPDTLPVAPTVPMALTQLFRHSLRDARVHPLLHLVQRYRQEPPR